MRITLGEIVKVAREQKGMTQEELAKAAGVSEATIFRLENNVTQKPTAELLGKLSKILDVELRDLLDGTRLIPEE